MAESKFTASNAHFLIKPGLIISLVVIGREENGFRPSVSSRGHALGQKEREEKNGEKPETESYEL